MNLLFRIVYAAHANGTHHKLALDGLAEIAGPSTDAWQRLFLKHASEFMDGAKAPDTKFKDFKNHVLHVRDGYWGGAPDLASVWYGRTVDELRAGKWPDAVHAAGVLSHYITDPLMPFHTGQTDAESAIHAAAEWSINRSYNDLRKQGLSLAASAPGIGSQAAGKPPTASRDAAWLRETLIEGAERSNADYERLIAHYDIQRGVVDPPSGLDDVSRRLVAKLLIDAAATFATILSAAIEEANVTPPEVNLTLDTVLAAIKIPLKSLAKRLSDAADRAVVEAQYDELITTGTVEKTLREDDRAIRDLHAVEVLVPRRALAQYDRTSAIKPSATTPSAVPPLVPTAVVTPATVINPLAPSTTPTAPQVRQSAPIAHIAAQDHRPLHHLVNPSLSDRLADATPATPVTQFDAVASPSDQAVIAPVAVSNIKTIAMVSAVPSTSGALSSGPLPGGPLTTGSGPSVPVTVGKSPRVYLAPTDTVDAAPVIGMKLAQRLVAVGVVTIADLMSADPATLARELGDPRITTLDVENWQRLSQLVMDVPGLRGTHAQLLVGAGYRTLTEVAEADVGRLVRDVSTFAQSAEGTRTLRDGAAPSAEAIAVWFESARTARRRRAAA